MSDGNRQLAAATRVVSSGRPHGAGEPLNTPVELASTFVSDGGAPYARSDEGTAGWRSFEEAVGALEDAHTVSYASGLAACAAISL